MAGRGAQGLTDLAFTSEQKALLRRMIDALPAADQEVDAPDVAVPPVEPPDENIHTRYVTAGSDLVHEIMKAKRDGIRCVTLQSGDYKPFALADLGTSRDQPFWIKAEMTGGVTVQSELGQKQWEHVGDGIYRASHRESPWAGYCVGKFLFRFNTKRDLERGRVRVKHSWEGAARDVKAPRYGFAFDADDIYLRLPDDADPNQQPFTLTDRFSTPLIRLTNSPYVILDGIRLGCAGNAPAVSCDPASHHVMLRNAAIEQCRFGMLAPDNAMIEWCRFTYHGLKPWADDVIQANGGDDKATYHLVKGHFVDPKRGNAYLEGRLATSGAGRCSSGCKFRHNLLTELWDGEDLGEFQNSDSRHSIYEWCLDDAIQVDGWHAAHHGTNVRLHNFLIKNCQVAISLQDKGSGRLKGPARIYRGVVINTEMRPEFLIKNMGLKSLGKGDVKISRLLLHVPDGSALFYDTDEHRSAEKIAMRNCIVAADGSVMNGGKKGWPDIDNGLLIGFKDRAELSGPRGYFIDAARNDSPIFEDWGSDRYALIEPIDGAALDKTVWGASSAEIGVGNALSWPRLDQDYSDVTPERWQP